MPRPLGRGGFAYAARALVAPYQQRALWLQRITEHMAGVAPTAGRDAKRGQETTLSDGSFGVGWQLTQNGVLRLGYLAPVELQLGVLDAQQVEQWTEQGIQVYQGPVALVTPPPVLAKGDVLVMLTDPRRFVVGDMASPAQVFGQALFNVYRLEGRAPADIIYQIPLQ